MIKLMHIFYMGIEINGAKMLNFYKMLLILIGVKIFRQKLVMNGSMVVYMKLITVIQVNMVLPLI